MNGLFSLHQILSPQLADCSRKLWFWLFFNDPYIFLITANWNQQLIDSTDECLLIKVHCSAWNWEESESIEGQLGLYSSAPHSSPDLIWRLWFYRLISSLDWSCLHSCCYSYILNFLRTSELTLPCDFKETELLRKEADFYQIEPLIQCLGDPKPLLPYPTDTYEEVVELSSTRKLSKYSNPVAVIINQLTITTKVSGNRSDSGCDMIMAEYSP